MTKLTPAQEDGGPDSSVLDAAVVCMVRDAARKVVNTNCTFIDDDLRVLCHLACRAIEADLIDQLPESIQRCISARQKDSPND